MLAALLRIASVLWLCLWCTADRSRAWSDAGVPHAPRRADLPWPARERPPIRRADAGVDAGDAGVTRAQQEARRLGLLPGRTSQLEDWPPEPDSPRPVTEARFAEALAQLCPEPERGVAMAAPVLESAAEFEIDPFLLAALAYHQSRCRHHHAGAYGLGLTSLYPGMHQRNIRDGVHRYGKPDGRGGFLRVDRQLPKYPFTPRALRAPRPNLYFAAALLRAFDEQCPAIDPRFDSVPHRHFVSHFVWGDRVRATRSEDEILIARRRLIQYYAPYAGPVRGRAGTIALASPLDGAPRLLIGVMGDPRDGGRRIHLGVDLDADGGEPVRAMGAGVVSFAGIDRGARGLFPLSPEEAERARGEPMGPRGLFVRIDHGDGIETLYAHLARYRVSVGQTVQAGEQIGENGRTGMLASEAHLHLGVFVDGLPVDPWPIIEAYAVRATRTQHDPHEVRPRPEPRAVLKRR